MRYQVCFVDGNYCAVDFETDDYAQAREVAQELYRDAYLCGERHFDYIIKDTEAKKNG